MPGGRHHPIAMAERDTGQPFGPKTHVVWRKLSRGGLSIGVKLGLERPAQERQQHPLKPDRCGEVGPQRAFARDRYAGLVEMVCQSLYTEPHILVCRQQRVAVNQEQAKTAKLCVTRWRAAGHRVQLGDFGFWRDWGYAWCSQ